MKWSGDLNGKANLSVSCELKERLESDKINFNAKSMNDILKNILIYYFEKVGKKETEIKEELEKLKLNKNDKLKVVNKILEIIKNNTEDETNIENTDKGEIIYLRHDNASFEKCQQFLLDMEVDKVENFILNEFYTKIFNWYKSLKQYQREIVVCYENYKKINEKITKIKKNKKSNILKIELIKEVENSETREFKMVPLELVVAKEENFCYVIGYTDEKEDSYDISSIRLSKIKNVKDTKSCEVIRDTEVSENKNLEKVPNKFLDTAKDMKKRRDVTSGAKQYNIVIRLTEDGNKLLKRKVHNRPFPPKKLKDESKRDEDGKYTYEFKGQYFDLFKYFFAFGGRCEIIKPKEFREKFKEEFTRAYKVYK